MAKTVAIVGAGASGLLCAIFCAKAGAKVEVFEQNSKPAKKILVAAKVLIQVPKLLPSETLFI